MKTLKILGISVASGVVITLLTGLLQNNQLIGASWYGYPMTWLYYRVLAPQYNPWYPNYTGLVVDIVFWAVIVAIVLLIAEYANRSQKQGRKKKGK